MRIAIVGASRPIHEKYCTHWTGLDAAFTRLPFEYKRFCCRYDELFVEKIIAYTPDVVIYNLIDLALNASARIEIREKLPDAKIVLWYTDCRTVDTGQQTSDISDTVDLFAVSNDGLKGYQNKHFGMTPVFVPQAAEPLEKPVYSEKAARDFLFIGGKINRPGFIERFNIIDGLERRHGLYVLNGSTPEERAKIYRAMPLYYGSAQFSLDISHFWDIPKYTSNRYWVIPAYWGFPLTRRFPGHEELFPETTRVYWSTEAELLEKMAYYRKHKDERKKMVEKGWLWAKAHHTYEHRIKRILDLLHMVY